MLREIVNNSMKTSLSITSYGLAFPDFRRAIFPIWTDEDFDRGRLAEDDWRQTASALRKKFAGYYSKQQTTASPDQKLTSPDDSVGPESNTKAPVLLSQWRQAINDGSKPAVIFNATVMETGRRVLFTPLSSVQSKWVGWDSGDKTLDPERYNSPQTYSEFIGASDKISVDVWTGARLSATFSYVSPAARASFATLQNGKIEREPPKKESLAFQHVIDGGYHDNSGVASALDWLAAAIGDKGTDDLPFDRIALVEIRAKPFDPSKSPSSEWAAAWLGPINGILNSWDFAQTASDDTAVSRMVKSFQRYISKQNRKIQLQSFVFIPVVPEEKGPLSWHLSKKQKTFVCKAWLAERNKRVLTAFLGYVKNGDPQKPADAPAPLDDCKTAPEK